MNRARTPLTRRDFLWMAAASTLALGQGITTRNVKPIPRGKPSGIPFLAHFTDVAAQAGLTAPVIYGGLTHKNYIVETVGCGVAFLDYDNDGWLDIFVKWERLSSYMHTRILDTRVKILISLRSSGYM